MVTTLICYLLQSCLEQCDRCLCVRNAYRCQRVLVSSVRVYVHACVHVCACVHCCVCVRACKA